MHACSPGPRGEQQATTTTTERAAGLATATWQATSTSWLAAGANTTRGQDSDASCMHGHGAVVFAAAGVSRQLSDTMVAGRVRVRTVSVSLACMQLQLHTGGEARGGRVRLRPRSHAQAGQGAAGCTGGRAGDMIDVIH